MTPKTPVMLLVQVETIRLRWFVSAVGLDGATVPLLRSEEGDLEKYQGLPFDDQVSFLRHRFCGVLQRGCDRLWSRDLKACQFVIVFDGLLPDPTGELTRATANHFVTWMLNPPVAVFNRPGGILPLEPVAGCLDPLPRELLLAQLGALQVAMNDPNAWELSRKKP